MRASLAHVARMRSNEICTRVGRPMIWWDVIGRVKSGHVGSSRYMSGQSGRYFFRALFRCYAFASVFPLLESVPGSGKFTPTYADARLAPVTWRLEWQSVVSGRLMSGQVDPSRSRSIQVVWFSFFLAFVWLGLRAFSRCLCWVRGSSQAWKGPPSHPDSLPSGSHGFMMMKIRSQQCLFVFRHRAIISRILMHLPWSEL